MRRLMVLVAALAAMLVLGAIARGDTEPRLDIKRVIEVELLVAGGVPDAEILETYSQAELDAGKARQQYSETLSGFDWASAVGGSENYGGVRLEDNGTITLMYVLEAPDERGLPTGFEYEFTQVEETDLERRARQDAEFDWGDYRPAEGSS